MIGSNYSKNKISLQPFHENQFQYPADASNQMQPRGNLPAELSANAVNFIGNNHVAPVKNAEAIAGQQRLHFSLGNHVPNENPVSTGLRLSSSDDERNSSITSGGGGIAASSVFSSLGYDIRRELDRQKEELDQFIRSQEENMARGVRSLKQQHLASLVKALEKGAAKKLQEKDLELANITRKNQELIESMKQVAAQAQTWCNWAKHNESVIDALKKNIKQAIEDSKNQAKEGTGESEAASCIDPNNYLEGLGNNNKGMMLCRSCGAKEVSMLLMPCRHLCLCKDCGEGSSVGACPVCLMATSGRFEVYLS